MLKYSIYFTAFVCAYGAVQQAAVVLNNSEITGRITFTRNDDGSVQLDGTIYGLPPGNHGFHIHEKGDLDNSCVAAGGHFNPAKKDHGAPSDENRHVGDLGNIYSDNSKTAVVKIVDKLIALEGKNGIIGRALVIHAGEDDLGRGGYEDSRTTGHAGARLACGVIGIALSAGNSQTLTGGCFTLLASVFITLRDGLKI